MCYYSFFGPMVQTSCLSGQQRKISLRYLLGFKSGCHDILVSLWDTESLLLIERLFSHPLTKVHLKTKFKFAIENKLRSFQFKLLHDIIPNNQCLWKMNFCLFCRTFSITNKTLGSQLGIINAFTSSALWIAQTKDPFLPQYIYKLCRSYMQQPVAERKQYYPVKVKEKTSCTFQSISILTE